MSDSPPLELDPGTTTTTTAAAKTSLTPLNITNETKDEAWDDPTDVPTTPLVTLVPLFEPPSPPTPEAASLHTAAAVVTTTTTGLTSISPMAIEPSSDTCTAAASPTPAEFTRNISVLRSGGGDSSGGNRHHGGGGSYNKHYNNSYSRSDSRSSNGSSGGAADRRSSGGGRGGGRGGGGGNNSFNMYSPTRMMQSRGGGGSAEEHHNYSVRPPPQRYENRTWKKRDDPGWPRLPQRDAATNRQSDMDKDRESTPLSADSVFKKELHAILNSFQLLDRPLNALFIGDSMRDPRFHKLETYIDHVEHCTFSLRDARQAIGSLDTPVSRDCRKQFILLHEILLNLARKTNTLMQEYKMVE